MEKPRRPAPLKFGEEKRLYYKLCLGKKTGPASDVVFIDECYNGQELGGVSINKSELKKVIAWLEKARAYLESVE